MILQDHQELGGLVAMIRPYSEISVMVTCLRCQNVVCLDNNMQWLCRLYALTLFLLLLVFCGIRGVKESPLQQPTFRH